MLKPKWPTIDATNWNKNTSIKKWKSSSSTKSHRDKTVKPLTSSSITSSINNGTRIFSRHSKKMLKHLDHLRTDILKKSNKTDRHLKKNFHLTSNSPQLYWTSKSNKLILLSKRSKFFILIFKKWEKQFIDLTIFSFLLIFMCFINILNLFLTFL